MYCRNCRTHEPAYLADDIDGRVRDRQWRVGARAFLSLDAVVSFSERSAARCLFRHCRIGRSIARSRRPPDPGSRAGLAGAHRRDHRGCAARQLGGTGGRLAMVIRHRRVAGIELRAIGRLVRATRSAAGRGKPDDRARRAGPRASVADAAHRCDRVRRPVRRLYLSRFGRSST